MCSHMCSWCGKTFNFRCILKLKAMAIPINILRFRSIFEKCLLPTFLDALVEKTDSNSGTLKREEEDGGIGVTDEIRIGGERE